MSNDLPLAATSSDRLSDLAEAKRLSRSTTPAEHVVDDVIGPSQTQLANSPFQFHLRGMLLFVAAVSVLIVVMQFVSQFAGVAWTAVLIWFLILVFAHVTANFWGTRVAPGAGRASPVHDDPHERPFVGRVLIGPPVGAVRLSESARPGWPMFVATGAGSVIGGSIGGVTLALLSFERAGYTGILVGTISASIVGGFLGFLTSTFSEIALRAWKEAVRGAAAEPPYEAPDA